LKAGDKSQKARESAKALEKMAQEDIEKVGSAYYS